MSDLEQDPDPDQLFHETDPRIRIRIHIKMKLIRNTEFFFFLLWNWLYIDFANVFNFSLDS